MSSASEPRHALVIGIGNSWQGDDGAGIAVAQRVRVLAPEGVEVVELEGEPVSLVDVWAGAGDVYVVDAVSSGAPPGTVHRRDVTDAPLPSELSTASTHTIGVAEAVELARALGRLPRRLIVYGVEAQSVHAGHELSAAVARGVEEAAGRLMRELAEDT